VTEQQSPAPEALSVNKTQIHVDKLLMDLRRITGVKESTP